MDSKTPPDLIDHGAYKSAICEHHQDIMTCNQCQIFKNGVKIMSGISIRQRILHPIETLKLRIHMGRMARELKREQGL